MKRFFSRFLFVVAVICTVLQIGILEASDLKIGLVFTEKQYNALKSGKPGDIMLYKKGIEAFGGKMVILSSSENSVLTEMKIRCLDGLLIPGGKDVNPARYREDPDPKLETINDELDEFEYRLISHAIKNNLPILGICRGEQILNVFFGGSLIQDIPTHCPYVKPDSHRKKVNGKTVFAAHRVIVEPASRFYNEFKGADLVVPTYHHQCVKQIGKNFIVTGRSPDGIVEMIEGTSDQYIVGVQFHPEDAFEYDSRFGIFFKSLIDAVQKRKETCPQSK
ncbi:MAG: gamma-glutamyl-gamma-aminobutyrate hydrolase family protein [Candidatus Riflebacteria bacterium]|nr:gamma-glutamyl-gamma-aminobutyrate hydrolase family protein [Candidatus Riflebacteria bacterium]